MAKGRKRKKKKAGARFFRALLVIAVLVCVTCGALAFALFNRIGRLEEGGEIETLDSAQQAEWRRGITNILVIGLDSFEEEDTRSDVMMLVTVDRLHKEIKMASLARDIYIEIPGYSPNRLNASWAYGGHALLRATIEQNFGVRIDASVVLNFSAFGVMIDALGGYDMELSPAEFGVLEEALIEAGIDTSQGPGTYHLVARAALDFTRIRKIDSDLERNGRQRRAILALMQELRERNIFEIYTILWKVFPSIQTDMSRASMLGHLFRARSYLSWPVRQQEIPASGTWRDETVSGMQILQIDWEQNRKILHDFLFEAAPV